MLQGFKQKAVRQFCTSPGNFCNWQLLRQRLLQENVQIIYFESVFGLVYTEGKNETFNKIINKIKWGLV